MPLHPKVGADDFAALNNQLKLSLSHIQEGSRSARTFWRSRTNWLGACPRLKNSEAPSAPA